MTAKKLKPTNDMNEETDTQTPNERPSAAICGSAARSLPWWRKDKWGWPIEIFKGKPVKSAIRIICQNISEVSHSGQNNHE